MELGKKPPAILYLDKNGFYFYSDGLPTLTSLGFTPEVVRDMDVVNSTAFLTQIKTFVEQYQLTPSTISIVLSPNVTFEKDVVGLDKEQQDEAVKRFVDAIPFENVMYKTYPIEKGVKVIGSSEDLFTELKIAFEKLGFGIDIVIPFQLLGADQPLISNLTADNASQLLKRIYRYKQQSLFNAQQPKVEISSTPTTTTNSGKSKKNNTRLFAMIGVFAVLFAILGYMLMTMN